MPPGINERFMLGGLLQDARSLRTIIDSDLQIRRLLPTLKIITLPTRQLNYYWKSIIYLS